MATREEEHYELLQGQNELGSKETLDDFHGSRSDQEPGVSLIHRLRAQAKIRNGFVLSLIMSGAINVLLAAMLTRYVLYPSSKAQELHHIKASDISSYG